MRKPPLNDLLRAVAAVTWPTLREEYLPTCCIAGVRVLMKVFELYGYNSEPIPVQVHIFNKPMVRLLATGNPMPDDHRERLRLWEITGAWGIGIVPQSAVINALKGHEGGGYGGHLVLRVKDVLIDPTLQQAHRPERNVNITETVLARYDQDFLNGGRLPIEGG